MVNQEKIHSLALSSEILERKEAALLIRDNFAVLLDKEQAWKDLHQLTQDKIDGVRRIAESIVRIIELILYLDTDTFSTPKGVGVLYFYIRVRSVGVPLPCYWFLATSPGERALLLAFLFYGVYLNSTICSLS